jgi:MFS transporter, UMF1 family
MGVNEGNIDQTSIAADEKQAKRNRLAWYMYDFGNSAYAAVVLLAVFSAYFKGEVVGGAQGSWLWGLAVGIAMLVVAITSPLLGTIADFTASKKRLLFFFTTMCIIFTALLFFVQAGNIFFGMFFFIMAEIGYRSSQVYYNALLPEITTPEEMGKVSGNGWAIGSAGGVLCLVIVLAMIMLIGGTFVVRLAFFVTAIFFALSALPLFLWVKEKAIPQVLPAGQNYVSVAWRNLTQTIRSIRQYKEFAKFIVAFLIYNDGILMIMDFAAIIGAVLYGLKQEQLIVFMIIVQITSIGGAYLFGLITQRRSGKLALLISLILMIGAVVLVLVTRTLLAFYLIGALAGFALTGVQSVSRTVVGQMAPEGKSGEFYGLFAIAGRTSSFIGPTVYGWLAASGAIWFMNSGQSMLIAEQNGQRLALLSVIVFLVVGMVFLLFVQTPEFTVKKSPQIAADKA